VDFVASQDLPWTRVPSGHLGSDGGGALRKTLSRDEGDGAQTDLLAITDPQQGVLASPCDFYVLHGRGTVGGQPYGPGTYVFAPAGSEVDWQPAAGRTVLFAGHHGIPEVHAGQSEQTATVRAPSREEWVDMSWRGDEAQPADVKIRWLRNDEAGTVFLVGMLPGYRAPLEEMHPVYEESFKLTGDLLLGRRGVVRPGGYFFRSPGSWHGPLYSHTGNVSLIRKNGLGSTTYRDPREGCDLETLIPRLYDGDPSMTPCLTPTSGGTP
jgi:hypothetical protein